MFCAQITCFKQLKSTAVKKNLRTLSTGVYGIGANCFNKLFSLHVASGRQYFYKSLSSWAKTFYQICVIIVYVFCAQITCFKQLKNMVIGHHVLELFETNDLSNVIKIVYWSNLHQKHTHWRKGFSQLLYSWRFEIRFFSQRVKKLVVYFGLHEPSLDVQRREDQTMNFM